MNFNLTIFHKKCFWITLIIAGLLVKIPFFPIQNGDYTDYFRHWIRFIQENGDFESMKYPFHNYSPAYIYCLVLIVKSGIYPLFAIKILSIFFEYLLAFFIGKIVCLKYKNTLYILVCMAIFPVLPTVFLNSLFFGQSDAIYAAFAVGSVYFILAEKTWKSVLFLALSFMFKMQAMFLLPFFFVMMLKKQIKFYLFILIPIVYFLSILPAYLIGRPLSDLLNIYAMQASYYHKLTMNFPNLYVFINNDYYSIVKPVGLIITVVLTLIVGWYFGRNKEKMCFEDKIRLVFASAVIVPFILPGMHDRYLYLADSLGIVYFIVFRKKIYIPLGTLFISTYAYIRFFVHYPYFYLSPAVFVYILVIIWIIKDFDIPLYRFSRHRKKLHIINGAT